MYRIVAISSVFTLLVLLSTWFLSAQESEEFDGEKALANIRQAMQARENDGFCGVLLIRHAGKTLLHEAYGFRDREANLPMAVEHGFDIGSLVKPITAIAILRLQQDGQLDSSDSIEKYCDNVPDDKKAITIGHLLEHKAGLPDIFGGDYQVVDKNCFLEKVLNCDLIAEVGQRDEYSNAGYSLLACIIEKVTSLPFEHYVLENVFKPAGTPRIGYRLPEWKNEDLAVGYRVNERWGTPLDKPWADDGPSWNLRGNGGMLATASDMCQWYEALIGGKIVDRSQLTRYYEFDAGTSKSTGSLLLGHAGGNGIFNTLQLSFVDIDFHMTFFSSVSNQQVEEVWKDFQDDLIGLAKQAANSSHDR